MDALQLKRRLAEKYGILIRYYAKPALRDHVRFSAGTPDQIDALLAALAEIGGDND
jgi:histidinol-phosphate/aromatic aminotransferase/cobyric acid decarboxylase-like protein